MLRNSNETMKQIKTLVIVLLVLGAGLLGWFGFERYYIWPTHKGLERAIRQYPAADEAYNAWLTGGDPSLRPMYAYARSLEALARWSNEEFTQLSANEELQLIYGRLALIAQKGGDLKGYERSMQQAMKASFRSGEAALDSGGPIRNEEGIVGRVEQADATAAWWQTWLPKKGETEAVAAAGGLVAAGDGLVAPQNGVSQDRAPQNGASVLERLQGTWISDREGTVAALRADPQWQDKLEMIDKLEPIFGKLVISYDGDAVFTQMDGERSESVMVIWNEKGNRARLVSFPKENPQPLELGVGQSYGIEVHDDHYWLVVPGPQVFRERFVRMKEDAETQAGNAGSALDRASSAINIAPTGASGTTADAPLAPRPVEN